MPVIYFDPAHHEATFSVKKLLFFLITLIGCLIIGFYTFSSTRAVEGGNLLLERPCSTPEQPEVITEKEAWFIKPNVGVCTHSDNSPETVAQFVLEDSIVIQNRLLKYYEDIVCDNAQFFIQKAWHNAGY